LGCSPSPNLYNRNFSKGNRTAAEFGHPEVQVGVKHSLQAAAHTQAGKTATLEALLISRQSRRLTAK
jgi:hypothetical protein